MLHFVCVFLIIPSNRCSSSFLSHLNIVSLIFLCYFYYIYIYIYIYNISILIPNGYIIKISPNSRISQRNLPLNLILATIFHLWELESPHTCKTNKFSIFGNLSSSSYLRSSQKHHVPLPSFFTPTTTYVLLKNPKNHCLRPSRKPHTSIFWAWMLMVA